MDVGRMVVDDRERGIFRVDRHAFVEPAVFEAEKQRVFERCWLYVGHESELTEPNAWRRRKVGGRWMIFLRDDENAIRVFFDTCMHRGNSLCRGAQGTAKAFQCFYHGWTFNTRGELIGVPDRKGYSPAIDFAELHLVAPPRIETYRGMVFLSFDPEIVDLGTYLGDAREYIDLMMDFSPSGMMIADSQHSYGARVNWKLMVENSIDVYHAFITHKRYFVDFIRDTSGEEDGWNAQMQDLDDNRALSLGNGHAVLETPAGPLPLGAKGAEYLKTVRRGLENLYGTERTHRILDYSRNLNIFPNLSFVGNFRTVRTYFPASVTELEISGWAMVGRDEPDELRRLRLDNYISFIGPGGFGTPDDVEALENCQRAFASADHARWSDISRGMMRAEHQLASDEIQMRAFWRRWYELMTSTVPVGHPT